MRIKGLFLVLLMSLSGVPTSVGAHAALQRQVQSHFAESAEVETEQPLEIHETLDGITIAWKVSQDQITAAMQPATAARFDGLTRVRFGGYWLPMRLEPVVVTGEQPITLLLGSVETTAWTQALPLAEPLASSFAAGDESVETLPQATLTVPTAPVFMLREGRLRGVRIAVMALSPIYAEAGQLRLASAVSVRLPNTKALPSLLSVATASTLGQQRLTPAQDKVPLLPEPIAPTNWVALRNAVKIVVNQPDMQQIMGDALMAAGVPAGTDLTRLHLWLKDQQVALEILDRDNRLDATSQIRFYAASSPYLRNVGDRWNQSITYWLTVENDSGRRIGSRSVMPDQAPLRDSAFEHSIWEDNKVYESTTAGVDGDHWFAAALETLAIQPDELPNNPVLKVPLTHTLPFAVDSNEPSTFILSGNARSVGQHLLYVQLGEAFHSLTWKNTQKDEAWQQRVVSQVHPAEIELALVAGLTPSIIHIDKVDWRQPVQLNFQGSGARFEGAVGQWRYALTNLPTPSTLYDVTDPLHPELLLSPPSTDVQFEDGPEVRTYLLAGPGTLHTPLLQQHTPILLDEEGFNHAGGADVLYIAPAHFHEELAPLLAQRRGQGYQVHLIDVQQIYDSWSYGQVSPEAIRAFLRYAVSRWSPAPIAAILVGDGTFDPHNYLGYQQGSANVTLIPPYMAPVDPRLGEIACESCFGQLDGLSPLDQSYDPGFLLDIWIGRLSVQDEVGLTNVIAKIIAYENAAPAELFNAWHQTTLSIADNYIHPDGKKDEAGDFASYADRLIEGDSVQNLLPAQSPQLITRRLYYDPAADSVTQNWREPNAGTARLRVIEELGRGPALVTYYGHSNHFQWATTDPAFDPPYLFTANDIFLLDHQAQPFVLLEMTCLTAQFTMVSPSGTTLDERFFRYERGGAVAVWGSAGLTVATGQDELMRGFHRQLQSLPPLTARLGGLIEAGYFELFARGACCQETRSSYVLLGDPLTPLLLWSPQQLYLPIIEK